MAYVPIKGWNGNPALDYAGTNPVSMDSPAPLDGTPVPGSGISLHSTITAGRNYFRLQRKSDENNVEGTIEFYMLFKNIKNRKIGVVHPASTFIVPNYYYSINGNSTGNLIGPGGWTVGENYLSDTPYYRYRLGISISVSLILSSGNPADEWVQFNIF